MTLGDLAMSTRSAITTDVSRRKKRALARRDRAIDYLAGIYDVARGQPTGHPFEVAVGASGRDIRLAFDPRAAFNPVTGRFIDWVPTGPGGVPIREAYGYAGKSSSFGRFWGPFATVLGGASAVVFGGPVGWVIGGLTIIGGFSWAADDVQTALTEGKATQEAAKNGAPPVAIEVTDAEAEEDQAAADEEEAEEDEESADSDVVVTDEEAEDDWEDWDDGEDMPNPDGPDGPGGPAMIRLVSPAEAFADSRGGSRDSLIRVRVFSGPGGSERFRLRPTSNSAWVAVPLYTPNPEGNGPQGPLFRPNGAQVVGFASFCKVSRRTTDRLLRRASP
jgi:hypothetical protein